MKMNIVEIYEKEHIGDKKIPDFQAGDTVVVQVKVKEGTRERLQAYEGVVIAKRNRSLNSAFTVRKISHGEGVERTFQSYSPLIASITVKRRGDVRKAKLYYLRDLEGRKARIKEKIVSKDKGVKAEAKTTKTAKPAEKKAEAKVEAKPEVKAKPKAEKPAADKPKAAPKAEAPKVEKPAEKKPEDKKE